MQTYHVWQEHGFIPPYKLTGFYSIPSTSLAEANPSVYNALLAQMPKNCGIGSCGVCGMSLVNNFIITDATGKKFSVGCDCVKKHGGTRLITEVEAQQKAIDKAKRAEKTRLKYEAQAAARKLEQEAQRERNGGMTDYELEMHNRKEKEQARIREICMIMHPVICALNDKRTDFCNSIVRQIEAGHMYSIGGRAIDIIDGICKKAKVLNAVELFERASKIE
jgi:hypothetical protein